MTLEEEIFANHYDYYATQGIETIKIQAGQAEQVSADYQGRIIYELLQNAFDKAEHKILVEVRDTSLFVVNDGTKFTYNAQHDYKDGGTDSGDNDIGETFERENFQALCSISTSNKSNITSIGNKGVGFKSVFSVAREGYVNIYTQGEIVHGVERVYQPISFRVYDSFKVADKVPHDFLIRDTIIKQIQGVQRERKDRGVPGYYYPLHITEEPDQVVEYFKHGYVTVIEIPFEDSDSIQQLFEEIKTIHFNFVSLKYHNRFEIEFRLNESDSFSKEVAADSGYFFSTTVKHEKIEKLAEEAGIQIGLENKIAICFKSPDQIKSGNKGLLYNYLPTKQNSPFTNVDLHADFHTSVDRKSVEFDNKSAIGRYNSALLNSCVELYYSVINSYFSDNEDLLEIDMIEKNGKKLQHFSWNYIAVNNSQTILAKTYKVLKFLNSRWHAEYSNIVHFVTGLVNQYFDSNNIIDLGDRNSFFEHILGFIHNYTNDSGMVHSRSKVFKEALAKKLKENDIQLLPNARCNESTEILYKETNESGIILPEFLGVSVTDYKIPDDFFSEQLGIKKYSDINVLFGYFRQISVSGKVSEVKLSEEQQIELLQCLYALYQSKKETVESFTHRYKQFITADRENYSLQNRAFFSVSTVFLKTKQGLYKPAQLCHAQELDESFLRQIVSIGEERDRFLLFIGVSPFNSCLVADGNIYEEFKDGISDIPAPLQKDEKETLSANEILQKISIVLSKKCNLSVTHPALVNYNGYRFFDTVPKEVREHLHPLRIGDYNTFPEQFVEILLGRITQSTVKSDKDIERFYQHNIFALLTNAKVKHYLNWTGSNYEWVNHTEFVIAKNLHDYELLKQRSKSLLCYFNGKEIEEKYSYLKEKIVGVTEAKPSYSTPSDISSEFKSKHEIFVPYILVKISHLGSHISERDFVNNSNSITEFQKEWEQVKIVRVNDLHSNYSYSHGIGEVRSKCNFLFESKEQTLFLDNNSTIADEAVAYAKHIYGVPSIAEFLELSIFHKSFEEFTNDLRLDVSELNRVKSHWLSAYGDKFKDFQEKILTQFECESIEHWYEYNQHFKSPILIAIDGCGRINELYDIISTVRSSEEFADYFSDFELKIDRSFIEDRTALLLTVLEQNHDTSNLSEELKILSRKLGSENRIAEIQAILEEKYPESFNGSGYEIESRKHELSKKNEINRIYSKFGWATPDSIKESDLRSNSFSTKMIKISSKKVIFKSKDGFTHEQDLEAIGASGEEEVLIYFINQFLLIKPAEQRAKAINEVYEILRKHIGNDSLILYKDGALQSVHDDELLKQALIPLFYVTLHHKYSYFDLIVFHENQPTLVEVKTSSQGKSFFISIAEIEVACRDDNYIIVINSRNRLNIIGNPIKDIQPRLGEIESDTFILKPKNFKIELKG